MRAWGTVVRHEVRLGDKEHDDGSASSDGREQAMTDTKARGAQLPLPPENLPRVVPGRLEHPGHRVGIDLGGGDAPVGWYRVRDVSTKIQFGWISCMVDMPGLPLEPDDGHVRLC